MHPKTFAFGSLGAAAWLVVAAACSTESPTAPVTITGPKLGTISVTVSTVGSLLDSDGYTVSVDSGMERPVGVNGTLNIKGLAIGTHRVRLAGVAGNCAVTGSMQRSIDVLEARNAAVVFSVACVNDVALMVTVRTNGSSPDPDGYLLTVDDAAPEPVNAIGTHAFTGLAAGPHIVTLTGIASNCVVGSVNPLSVTIVAGRTTQAGFTVTCGAPTGSVRVTITTSGINIGAGPYLVTIDPFYNYYGSGGTAQPVPVNGTVSFAPVDVGNRVVQLTSLPGNCTAADNPRTVSVTAGAVSDVSFAVECVAAGTLQVSAVTTGTSLDVNGYQAILQGPSATSGHVASNAVSTTFSPLPVGTYSVTLLDVAANCSVTSPNPLSVFVAANAAPAITFAVSCAVPAQIAFVDSTESAIYLTRIDGSGLARLTPPGSDGVHPSWSPDGQRLVFSSSRDGGSNLYTMNANGTNPTRLTHAANSDYQPAWSPDGTRIAFATGRDGNSEVYVMNADGTAPVRLTNHFAYDGNPSWSPDGQRLAFASSRSGASSIYVMNADGTNVMLVASNGSGQPAWSPDGQSIAYSSSVGGNLIYVVSPNGSGLRLVSRGGTSDTDPAWSADGTRILFRAVSCGYGYYYYQLSCSGSLRIVRTDGSDPIGVPTGNITFPSQPVWQP